MLTLPIAPHPTASGINSDYSHHPVAAQESAVITLFAGTPNTAQRSALTALTHYLDTAGYRRLLLMSGFNTGAAGSLEDMSYLLFILEITETAAREFVEAHGKTVLVHQNSRRLARIHWHAGYLSEIFVAADGPHRKVAMHRENLRLAAYLLRSTSFPIADPSDTRVPRDFVVRPAAILS